MSSYGVLEPGGANASLPAWWREAWLQWPHRHGVLWVHWYTQIAPQFHLKHREEEGCLPLWQHGHQSTEDFILPAEVQPLSSTEPLSLQTKGVKVAFCPLFVEAGPTCMAGWFILPEDGQTPGQSLAGEDETGPRWAFAKFRQQTCFVYTYSAEGSASLHYKGRRF